MNITTGQKTLASGNVFKWTHERISGRGAICGQFKRKPTDEDVAEAQAIARSLAPPEAMLGREFRANHAAVTRAKEAFLMPGVSRN